MDYLDLMDLQTSLDFTDWRNSYKEMMDSYEDLVCEAEERAKFKREDEQLRYFRRKENN